MKSLNGLYIYIENLVIGTNLINALNILRCLENWNQVDDLKTFKFQWFSFWYVHFLIFTWKEPIDVAATHTKSKSESDL